MQWADEHGLTDKIKQGDEQKLLDRIAKYMKRASSAFSESTGLYVHLNLYTKFVNTETKIRAGDVLRGASGLWQVWYS